jgi:hypothetical protein
MDITYDLILKSFKEWCNERPSLKKRVILRGDCKTVPIDTRAAWTNAVLNGLIYIGQNKFGFDTQPYRLYFSSKNKYSQGHKSCFNRPKRDPKDCGEFLVDLCWYDYGKEDIEYWKNENLKKTSLNLVVESEWGCLQKPSENADTHLRLIADDYVKLLHLNAEKRLFISSTDKPLKGDLIKMLERLRRCCGLMQGDICIWYWDFNAKWQDMDKPEVFFL